MYYFAKIDKWNGIVLYDKQEKSFIIIHRGKGGAVVSDTNLQKAEQKFIEAMNLAEKAKKLLEIIDEKNKPFNN